MVTSLWQVTTGCDSISLPTWEHDLGYYYVLTHLVLDVAGWML